MSGHCIFPVQHRHRWSDGSGVVENSDNDNDLGGLFGQASNSVQTFDYTPHICYFDDSYTQPLSLTLPFSYTRPYKYLENAQLTLQLEHYLASRQAPVTGQNHEMGQVTKMDKDLDIDGENQWDSDYEIKMLPERYLDPAWLLTPEINVFDDHEDYESITGCLA